MHMTLKTIAIAAAAVIGIASSGAFAQQSDAQSSGSSQMMKHGGMAKGQMMAMMDDPKMRQQMKGMMANCNRMMERMSTMSDDGLPAKPPHEKR
jgi:Spy/CpxP family protein refolding chaperone